MNVYEYVVWVDENDESEAEIVVKPTVVLAQDEAHVRVIAARAVPKSYEGRLNEVEILVRPFFG